MVFGLGRVGLLNRSTFLISVAGIIPAILGSWLDGIGEGPPAVESSTSCVRFFADAKKQPTIESANLHHRHRSGPVRILSA